ncbi:MAG: fumarylacetoacetate hydrolase family protein [Hyphomicrobiales bacterium]|nr:fumarylacetoacetate hydrolase family protein [Hyphomicrobiales bacterium]
MAALRLASFAVGKRASYGAVTERGIVDLGRRLARYPTLIDVFRAQATGEEAIGEARTAAAAAAPDHQLKDITLLPPITAPEKIICVGINYPERGAEYKTGAVQTPQKFPNLFCRFPTSLVGSEQPIVRPKVSDKFDYEGEIVLVIGREGRHIPEPQALGYIGGLTLGNEGSVRDWLRHGTLNVTQGKNFDASGSLGPWIVPSEDVDPGKPLRLTTRVNGQLRQDDTTDRLTWGFAWLISYISTFATLKPGDLIWTGTPTGAGGHQTPPAWLKPGDIVEVAVPEIGVLRNPVADEP